MLTKIHIGKAMIFLVVMYTWLPESWTLKKAEHQRIDAFRLWGWRRLLSVPWTARRPNQSILKEINPEYSLEGLMLKLKLQYFSHLMQSRLIGKDLDVRKDWGKVKKQATENEMVGWHHQLSGHEFEQAPRNSEGQGSLVRCSPRGGKESDTTQRLNNKHYVPNWDTMVTKTDRVPVLLEPAL